MSLTRQETQWYMTRFYRFLKEGHTIEFKRSNRYEGGIDYPDGDEGAAYVFLRPNGGILTTLIHEFLHHQHPEWSETRVLKMESKLVNSLSQRQLRNVIKRFAQAL